MKRRIENEINTKFKAWWSENGYKYILKSDKEGEWCVVVLYWVWKGFEAGRKVKQ